jgi:hypothetical protein
MFIRFVRPEGVPQSMDAHLFANPRLLDVLGNQIVAGAKLSISKLVP